MTISLKPLQEKREQLKASLAQINYLRRGSLTARFRKCGKPNCHCAERDSRGHGPSYSLTHAQQGKTVTQVIPQGPAVDRTRAQIAEYNKDGLKGLSYGQSPALVAELVGQARAAGYESINFDLIYGLPGQTPESMRLTAEQVLAEAQGRLDAGDLAGALAALRPLDGQAAEVMAEWRARAQALLDARAALAGMARG